MMKWERPVIRREIICTQDQKSFRNDIEISKEVEQESCNKLTQPLLKMFSGESVYPDDTGRNVAERKLGVNKWNHTRISNKK